MPRTPGARTKHTAPCAGDRTKAWTSMRVLIRFTRPQIEVTAGIKKDNLGRFVRRLVTAGYLRMTAKANGRPGSFDVYQLVRNTGPLVPVLWENGQVYDQNTREVFGEASDGAR